MLGWAGWGEKGGMGVGGGGKNHWSLIMFWYRNSEQPSKSKLYDTDISHRQTERDWTHALRCYLSFNRSKPLSIAHDTFHKNLKRRNMSESVWDFLTSSYKGPFAYKETLYVRSWMSNASWIRQVRHVPSRVPEKRTALACRWRARSSRGPEKSRRAVVTV